MLDDPANKASKVQTKDQVDHARSSATSRRRTSSIEYIESLDDWKTAWDHIHFQGFLGTKMILQFIWQGCDSLLAAPLVIDLARPALLAAAAAARRGVMRHLACFFKSPMGSGRARLLPPVGGVRAPACAASGRRKFIDISPALGYAWRGHGPTPDCPPVYAGGSYASR